MKKILIIVLALNTMLSCTSQTKEKQQTTQKSQTVKNTINRIDVASFKKGILNKNIQLIDVRTPSEYQQGHIANAQLINFRGTDFKSKVLELDKNKPVYLYCRSGGRSGAASKILRELGFKEINDLSGGYMAWSRN